MRAPQDTIVALSSALPGAAPAGRASLRRAIVRLSGPEALRLAETIFFESSESKRGLGWRRLSGAVAWGERRAPACLYLMRGPRSYTREDIVELHLPCVPPLVLGVLERLVRAGARPALPGEFTRRALLNGRISLTQAEAVGALVRAEHAEEARAWAARAVDGGSTQDALRKELEDLLALVELGLDFSQEDVEAPQRETLLASIRSMARKVSALSEGTGASDQPGLRRTYDPRVVLAGPPNAGKSRLFNALLGRPAAVVSPVRHTTRDTVEAAWEPIPGEPVILVDTAGLGEEEHPTGLHEQALRASRQAVQSADILVWVIDCSQPIAIEEMERLNRLGTSATVKRLVLNKADLPEHPSALHLVREGDGVNCLHVSAATGTGLEGLREFIAAEARTVRARLAAARTHGETASRTGLAHAAEALKRAEAALAQGMGEDAAVVELREAVHALSDASGVLFQHDALTERLLDRIFADFCIGK